MSTDRCWRTRIGWGKPFRRELTGLYSARLATQWRIIYTVDDAARTVTVETVQRRYTAYRR